MPTLFFFKGGRKVRTNLDSILKSRDITLPTKVHLVKAMVLPVVMYECENWTIKKAEHQRIETFWTVVLEKTPESPLDCKEFKIVHPKGNQSWISRCWSWNSNTLAIWCEEPTHLKRPWCRGRLKAKGEGDDRGWDGWLASPSQWLWFWVNSGSWWWTGKAGVLHSMGSQRVGHSWATELHWTIVHISFLLCHFDG